MHRIMIIVMLGVLTLVGGCGRAGEIRVDASDDSSRVVMDQGQVLIVTLEGNPTTGYTWEVEAGVGGVLREMGEPQFEPESEALGAGGVQVLRFEAMNTGRTALDLVYHRPWEEDVEPLETFSLEVIVR